ncbi:MAG: M3 family metallopeptidase [Bacteroidota bacterium]
MSASGTVFCILGMILFALPAAGGPGGDTPASDNPFLAAYDTPFGTPPFHLIRNEHFMPAFRKGMEEEQQEVRDIAANPAPPTFENTVAALENTGRVLERVSNVFFNLQDANTSEDLQAVAAEVTPLLARHRDDIALNEELFRRVKAVYDRREEWGLTVEQRKLLEDTYKAFVRNGANLPAAKKTRLRAINEELSQLSLQSSENTLKETNAFRLVVEKKEDLEGLPQSSMDAAEEAARAAGLEGKWVFTVHKPSMIPFLQYARNRELRERLFRGYIERGNRNNEQDNKAIVARIAALRAERAQLLGYRTHADYVLERNMARNPAGVYDLLRKLWEPALRNAKKEREDLQAMIRKEGGTFTLQPWDWWYYAEKVRKARYDLDENELRPYFQMDNVRRGAFDVASRLYGIRFVERKDIPVYYPEVTVFEVLREDGSQVGLLYTDYFPRAEKRAGAWCGGFRSQERRPEGVITPLVTNVGNFSRPAADAPSLLSPDEVRTLFHEFGHALHALLSDQTYRTMGVPTDFVELPSQIMENWAFSPEVLKMYARHYRTGEPIPRELVERISNSDKFNQGFITVEYLSACFLDLDWHTLESTEPVADVNAFERTSLEKIGLIPEIVVRYRSPYFAHVWSSGYSAGYYSYIWAAVLDADAFEAFKERGLFDRKTAEAFRENVLARGATDDAMKQYEKFRGRKPAIEPLLKRRGLL